ncbi:hypothetical protein BN1058_02697 [Paraliobacillus sp. PM-2]|uniref:DUF4064 domain-containing protein n=1 Tax=Paraliobacillus sp. PM-2 TaxID=1462524 RepID=UPI00061C4AD7|nr:DUF4064 domain-containing protein [Paraliobacillus sp. PM-2]CQR48330.1 hypothetical protein BN1058_02697 [Paraliobacillus sp. PM-2]
MKRTVEIILGIIGTLIYGIAAILGGSMLLMRKNPETIEEIYTDMVEQNPEVALPDFQTFIESMGAGAVILIVVSLAAMIAGIVAIVFLKGNKKPKAAGILFIVSVAVVTILPVGISIFTGIFYLAAGIMSLMRKPKEEIASL